MYFTDNEALTHEASRWDRVRWSTRAGAHAGLRDAERDMADTLRGLGFDGKADSGVFNNEASKLSRTFAGEVFARLASDPDAIEGAGGWAAKAQSVVDELPEFEALRAAVVHDSDMAALATKEILKAVTEKLPGLTREDEDGDKAEDGEQGKPSREHAAMRSALRRAIEAATESVTEAREALNGLAPGMGSAPAVHEQEDTTRLTLAQMLLDNPEFRDVLRRAGKLRRIANAKMKTRGNGVGTVVGLERGADLGRVLPAQLARLKHPIMRLLVKKDLAERALMQYRVEGREPKGRGPIILLIDESASMQGDPARWAKAVVIAALHQGAAEKRPVGVAFFNNRIRDAWMVDADGTARTASRSAPAIAGEVVGKTSDLVGECLRRGVSGGTSFSPPLEWALSALEEGDARADLILVTDGRADADEQTRERLAAQRERGTSVYALTVGVGDASSLEGLADEILRLDR